MLVMITNGGRLGNQLMFAANLMASSLEYGIPYKNIDFKAEKYFVCDPTVEGTENTYKKELSKLLNFWFWKSKRVLGKCPGIKEFSDDEKHAVDYYVGTRDREGYQLCHCWPYLDFHSLYKHQDEVRRRLHPKAEYVKESEEAAERLGLKKHQPRVGIHMRLEDYKTWMDGKYYFTPKVYKTRMDEIAALYPTERVQFVIFSNEAGGDPSLLENDSYDVVWSGESAIVDMLLMSNCDLLVSPPSTFSGFASFMGNVPRYIMLHKDNEIKGFDEFGVYMIDHMDNELDKDGNKVLTKLEKRYVKG